MSAIKKTYRAKTSISINIVLSSKKNLHISFAPLSKGGSTYTTDNEDIQKGLESHYKFGTLFRVDPAVKVKTTLKKSDGPAENNKIFPEVQQPIGTETEQEQQPKPEKVTVTDLSAAKEYLADRFGISRTSLRSRKAIIEQATAHRIEFEGLE